MSRCSVRFSVWSMGSSRLSLLVSCLKLLHYLSKDVFTTTFQNNFKSFSEWFIFFKVLMIHLTCAFLEYQTEGIADHCLEAITWGKVNFHCYRRNVFSKLLWIIHWFQGVWYRSAAFFSNIKLGRLQIAVLKYSHDLSKTVNF